MTNSAEEPPEPVRHFLPLEDGRNMAYYTFLVEDGNEDPSKKHPVLYLHGFPGSGLEGVVCAREVALAGGCLFSPDRPGFGYSDPWPKLEQISTGTSDNTYAEGHARMNLFIKDLWSLVRMKRWQSFSVIGVSGGGPYAAAMLASYLEARFGDSNQRPVARLAAVSLVASMCCSAGVDGMMPKNKALCDLVSKRKTSWWSETKLHLMFGVSRLFLTLLPMRLVLKAIPTKDLPEVDKASYADPAFGPYMMKCIQSSFRQGSTAAVLEAAILYYPEQGFETALKKHYQKTVDEGGDTDSLPRVAIFQGDLDVNVSPSHAAYIQKEWLSDTAKFVRYQDLGHISMIVQKADDFSQFAVHG